MATKKGEPFNIKDLEILKVIYKTNPAMMVFVVGNSPLENWIGFETELANRLNYHTLKLNNLQFN